MPRYQLPPTPKGFRQPGSGRPKGQPNKISIEVRRLVSELINNAAYQHKLRQDFAKRKVHPAIEALIWTYHLGKPKQTIDLNATVDVSARIEEERQAFALLDIREMEELAAESQRLVDRAMALARGRIPQDVVVSTNPVETGAALDHDGDDDDERTRRAASQAEHSTDRCLSPPRDEKEERHPPTPTPRTPCRVAT